MNKLSFQDIILKLQNFWVDNDCLLLQPYDLEMGAGTLHPATTLRALKPEENYNVVYVQGCRRPTDGRYGENPNRLQHYYQLQVILKPSPDNIQDLFLKSLAAIGLNSDEHDIRFIEDDWENPSIGAWGLGWEIWCDGMEIAQFTYMQQIGGIECKPIPGELTYGLERIAMYIQEKESVYDLEYNHAKDPKYNKTYGDLFFQNEVEQSKFNFEESTLEDLYHHFAAAERNSKNLIEKKLAIPAYEQCLKASHLFNLLEARGAVSVTDRAGYIAKIRNLAKAACSLYVENSAPEAVNE